MNFYNKEKSPNYLKGIFEIASEGILVADTNGYILRCNPAFYRLLGYEKDELNGKVFTEIVHKNASVQRFTSLIKSHYFQRSSELPLEIELVNKEGIAVPVKLRSTLIKDDKGKIIEAIGVVEDLREDKGERKLEQKVWETQEYLNNILTNSGDAILVANDKGRITSTNEALFQMLGYQEDEVLGRHLLEFSPYEGSFTTTTGEEVSILEEYHNYNIEKANELFEKGKITNYELYFIRKDGMLVPIEATISVLKDQKGERKGSIAICRDITERKKAESKVKETRDFLENVIESSRDGIAICNKLGDILSVNTALEKMCLFRKEELMGKHISMLTIQDKEIRKHIIEKTKELFKKGSVSYESKHEVKGGNYVEVECDTSLVKDNKGNYVAGVSIIRDITERKKAEEALRKSEEKYQSLIENANDAIISLNKEGVIISFNKKAEEMFGYSHDEVVGKSITLLSPLSARELELKALEELKKGKTLSINGKTLEGKGLRKDGQEIPVESSVYALEVHGEYIITSIIRDISERKRAEEKIIEYQNKLRSLASQLTLTEERERRRIATDLHDRIGQALAISKIKLGGLRESTSSIGLDGDIDGIRDLIEQTIQDTRSLIFDLCPPFLYELGFEKALEWLIEEIQKQHGVTTLFENDGKPKPLDDNVRVLLFRTVSELLMNVVKHARAQKAKVSVQRDGDNIQIKVEDDGIGFDVSKIQYHIDKTGGFGLFRIRERLNYLGGQLKVKSEPNQGTRVSLVVPLRYNGKTLKEGV
jgi:PAS domain S-box-containing protein